MHEQRKPSDYPVRTVARPWIIRGFLHGADDMNREQRIAQFVNDNHKGSAVSADQMAESLPWTRAQIVDTAGKLVRKGVIQQPQRGVAEYIPHNAYRPRDSTEKRADSHSDIELLTFLAGLDRRQQRLASLFLSSDELEGE